MAGTVNQIVLIGRLGRDPELNDAGTVAKFSLATDDRVKTPEGTWEDETDWHNIVLIGNSASIAQQYLRKGSLVAITGKQKHRKYEKDGVTKYFSEVKSFDMTMLGGRDDNADAGGAPVAAAGFDDDVPF